MTDEEVNSDTAHWPSEINIVSLSFRIKLSYPLFIQLTITQMNSDQCVARSSSRRIERRCVRVFLWASARILLNHLLPPSLDAGHCGQQPATTHPNEVDGLDECPYRVYTSQSSRF